MPKASSRSVRVFYPRLSRDQLISILRERLPELAARLPLKSVILFGSYARGTHTAASDIDLLVVYADPPRPDAFKLVKRTLGVRGLEPHVYAEGQYADIRATLDRMTRNGITLWTSASQ